MNKKWAALNGRMCLEAEAMIPIADRGFLFGEGFFTTIRVSQGKCEFFNEHLLRLKHQAEAFGVAFNPHSFDWLEELIAQNNAEEGIWRLKIIVTIKGEQGSSSLGNILATLSPCQGDLSEPCRLCLYPQPLESPTSNLKTLSYLDHLQVKKYAIQKGFQDALTTNSQGFLLEAASSNIFWIDQNILWMPHHDLPYLKGVFLKSLLKHLPIPHQGVKVAPGQLPATASVYLCNSLTHVRPVISIEQKSFPRNPHWENLMEMTMGKALFAI